MASFLSEEQFQCCICLDIFTEPVSIPCGHNFCLGCIRGYWDTQERPECPLCKETFRHLPQLQINRGLRDITEHFTRSLKAKAQQTDEGVDVVTSTTGTEVAEVSCNICTGNKLKAVKSCLVCQVSYCETHLAPHQRERALQRHRLTDPDTFTSRHLCRKHNMPLQMFCRNDKTPLCVQCAKTDHKAHTTVPMERESSLMKTQLKRKGTEVQQMIQDRVRKVEEINRSLELSRKSVEREMEGSVLVFSELVSSMERSQAELIQLLEEKQRAEETRAEGLVSDLVREITDLQRRSAELEQLTHTEDHLHLLQSFPSISTPLSTKDWSEVSVHSAVAMGTVRRAVSKLVDLCHELEKKLSAVELNRTHQYAVDVTLDPTTAAGWLDVSADRKEVRLWYKQKLTPVPDDPRRFESCVCVLGEQGFTTGRRYWVVQVGDKTEWDLGVARESVNRKGSITVRPDSGYWAICRRKGNSVSACTGPSVLLHPRESLRRVGVFLDYEEGMVSFYNAEAKTHIYTYSGCVFTETLHPYFNPCLHDNGRNVAPLFICPVETGGFGDESEVRPTPLSESPRSKQSPIPSISHETLFENLSR